MHAYIHTHTHTHTYIHTYTHTYTHTHIHTYTHTHTHTHIHTHRPTGWPTSCRKGSPTLYYHPVSRNVPCLTADVYNTCFNSEAFLKRDEHLTETRCAVCVWRKIVVRSRNHFFHGNTTMLPLCIVDVYMTLSTMQKILKGFLLEAQQSALCIVAPHVLLPTMTDI
jgi:hypothetical protein